MGRRWAAVVVVVVLFAFLESAEAARLEPKSRTEATNIRSVSQSVRVVLTNGFAMTEVRHTFENLGERDLEATYSFPLPRSATLAELSILAGEKELQGEVLPRAEATRAYEEERDKQIDPALGTKHGYESLRFAVYPVPAGQETTIRFVYYQPLEIDTEVGRYLYPLADGGTDEGASFWKPEVTLGESLDFVVELRSSWPVAEVRLPGFDQDAKVERIEEGHYKASLNLPQATLNRDIVFYYRLKEGLPGRVELIPYREGPGKPGTFMLVVTPGLDLKPITDGSDHTYVVDVSGSMSGKMANLTRGLSLALRELDPQDRFRVVAFNDTARYLGRGYEPATEEAIVRAIRGMEALAAEGGTNLYEGIRLALSGLDGDRAQSVVLVTDAVANKGVLDPAAFLELMKKVDVRAFGLLMGNSGNWPLMRAICESSGGFYAQVSTADDMLGQIVLAKSKVSHECLHDASLRITGIKAFDTTDPAIGKVFRGQQLVFFGRYEKGGKATVTLSAKLTGEDKVYRTEIDFPETDTENPELERLWAMHRVEAIEAEEMQGKRTRSETARAVKKLGVDYQIVTEETAMVVLEDEVFTRKGIERKNLARVARERQARAQRSSAPARNRRVDEDKPMFKRKAPRIGGGALDPISVGLLLALTGFGLAARRHRKKKIS